MASYFLYNIANLVVAQSDNNKPLRGKRQGEIEVIPDAYILIKGGLIEAFGRKETLVTPSREYTPMDMQQSLVMPAFVDPHTHLVFAGSREKEFAMRLHGDSYLEILSKGYGIHQTVQQTESASFDELLHLAQNRLIDLERYGTVGIEIKSGYGLKPAVELKQLRVIRELKKRTNHPIATTFLAAHALPMEFKNKREDYIQQVLEETIPEVAREGLADFIDVFCEKNVFSIDECERILLKGASLGLRPKLHSDEFFSIGGIPLATRVEAVSVDHMITATDEDLQLLQGSDTVAVVLPGTSFNIPHARLDYARKIIEADIPLAIGTDFNPGTCMCYSQQIMMELSILLYGLTIKEAINAVTVNSSFAAGLQESTGMMKEGYRADFVSMNIRDVDEIPYIWGINKIQRIFLSGDKVEFEA
ncbi:MAG: imidazolonepropionase [Caldisericia bacterium]|nr:imidazolonepropionase [Caldisericia bacterium]